jgi:hypothetical protein
MLVLVAHNTVLMETDQAGKIQHLQQQLHWAVVAALHGVAVIQEILVEAVREEHNLMALAAAAQLNLLILVY